jgi:hypothetical protein
MYMHFNLDDKKTAFAEITFQTFQKLLMDLTRTVMYATITGGILFLF